MILAAMCALGMPAGMLLLGRVPTPLGGASEAAARLSVIIPARNEEASLPHLLESLQEQAVLPLEVLVVDDGSTDATASVAESFGARVVLSQALPPGWTGKTWACHQGAQAARGELLLFLDADTFFLPGGLDRVLARWEREGGEATVLSVAPYHVTLRPYEQLSVIFHVMMAAGAGGFGRASKPRLFGQSMLLSRQVYEDAGGHASVRGQVLENLYFADRVRAVGARPLCLGGRGSLAMRMFPEGPRQMTDSWTKAFVHGASASAAAVVACSVVWISAMWIAALALPWAHGSDRTALFAAYTLLALLLWLMSRQLGTYSLWIALLYPVALGYYCVVFGRSLARKLRGQNTLWRGRPV